VGSDAYTTSGETGAGGAHLVFHTARAPTRAARTPASGHARGGARAQAGAACRAAQAGGEEKEGGAQQGKGRAAAGEEGRTEEGRAAAGEKGRACPEASVGVGRTHDQRAAETQRPPVPYLPPRLLLGEFGMLRPLPLLTLLLVSVLAACSGAGSGKTAWTGATVLTGTGTPIPNAVIIVAEGHIEAIGSADEVRVPRGTTVRDVSGRWIIPGLIDSHVHAERWTLPGYLAYGVTSVRDAGGIQDSVIFLRDDVSSGTAEGPRLYVSGAMVDAAPAVWPGATAIRTPSDARRAVGNRVLIGATQVKVYTKVDRRLLAPLMDEAKALEMPVAAHLGRVDAVTAAQLGVRSLEHMSGVIEAALGPRSGLFEAHADFFRGWNASERGWSRADSAALQRTADRLVAAGVAIVPTLALHDAWAHLADDGYTRAVDVSRMPPGAVNAWNVPDLVRRAGITAADFAAFRRSRPAQDLFVRLFHRAGGLVAAGSDSPNQLLPPGASLHRELALLVAAGLTPDQALLAATRDAAQLLAADSIGVLRTGGVADFVVLRADPRQDIANVGAIDEVVAAGYLVQRSSSNR
jgi:imidazolonepropionase-like amidohydrolase